MTSTTETLAPLGAAEAPAPSYTKTPETDRGYGERRTITHRWETADGSMYQEDPERHTPEFNAVELSITYDKDAKAYRVDVSAVKVDGIFVTHVFDFADKAPRTVRRVPAARYSRKTLDAVAADALADFPGIIPPGGRAAGVWALIARAGA